VQAFQGRWSGNGFYGEEIGDRVWGRGKLEAGSVDDFRDE
jgi:hypothetical protein